MKEIKIAIVMTLLFVVLTGLAFPLAMYAIGQVLFPDQANGSFRRDAAGKAIGSALIGQQFTAAKYFHPRPSAAGAGYDAAASSGTNLGPISAKLIDGIKDDPATPDTDESYSGVRDLASMFREENNLAPETRLPADAATRSSSGLDPEISPANALLQAARVARERGMETDDVIKIVRNNTASPFLGLFGEPRVNVLAVNLELDKRS